MHIWAEIRKATSERYFMFAAEIEKGRRRQRLARKSKQDGKLRKLVK